MIPTYVSTATTVWGVVSGAFSGKDPERLAANQQAYTQAIAGDANALLFLKQRTGNYGIAFVPGYGEIGGWATDEAKADALAKYQAALATIQAQQAAGTVGGIIQSGAQATGHTIIPGTTSNVVTYLVIGGAVIAALAFYARKRR